MVDYGKLRSHQADAVDLASHYVRGRRTFADHKVVTANICPGGGKTLMSLLYTDTLLRAGLIEQAVIVTPRESLVSQMVEGWNCPERGVVRVLANGSNSTLSNGQLFAKTGYVTTYQAVAAGSKRHAKKIGKLRTLLILDEPHHLALRSDSDGEGIAWYHAVLPLFERATHVLLMSGTLVRHDRERIPFVTYDDGRPVVDIVYSRKQAIEEEAILPLEIQRIPADTVYQTGNRVNEVALSDATAKQETKALRAALERPEYRDERTLAALAEWENYRRTTHDSSAIVIVHNQATAKHVARVIRERMGVDVALAISSESQSARTIRAFRKGHGGRVLVTVGMAYEGLDVPHATHMVCLTATRSEPWLEQAFARITRFNPAFGEYAKQRAFLYVPDDPSMRGFLDRMTEEQDLAVKEKARREGHEYVPPRTAFRALEATPGESRYSDSAGNLSDAESALVNWMRKETPGGEGKPARELLALAEWMRAQGVRVGGDVGAAE